MRAESISTRYRPRNELEVVQVMGSRRQRGPRLGPATSLGLGPQKQGMIINPRNRDAERRGSRPQVRRAFTTKPCWDLSSRDGRRKARTDR